MDNVLSIDGSSQNSDNGFEPGHFLFEGESVQDLALGLNSELEQMQNEEVKQEKEIESYF